MESSIQYLGYADSRRIFDDPFLMPSSQAMPDRLDTAMDFCLFLYFLNPQYRQASARVVSHFITDFDYPGDGSKSEKDNLDDFLHFKIQLPLFLRELGEEWSCYGNGFARIHFPFDRFLIDKKTGSEYALDMFGARAKFNYRDLTYNVPSPRDPKTRINLEFRDRKSMDVSRIRLRKLNPRWMHIWHNFISGRNQYVWQIEKEIVDDVKKGRLHVVNDCPLSMLQAIKNGQDYLFDSDTIFHLKSPTISGITNQGWGLPGTIANFRNIHQLQVYRKIDEAVGLDYMLPFRLFSPAQDGKVNDALDRLVMPTWTSNIKRIIDSRRRDKFAMHSLPFPVNYQEFGAEGKQLAPKDLIEYQTGALLDGMGFPQELFKGTLQYVQVPTAMRLFENTFMFMHTEFNQFCQWVVRRVNTYLGQEPITVRLQRPAMADDLERRQLILQMVSVGEISRETGFEFLGIDDVAGEIKKRTEEDAQKQRIQAKAQAELQREMETGSITSEQAQAQPQGQGGSLPGSGPPPSAQGGGGGPVTPMDVQRDAQELAQYWMSIPSTGERSKAMQSVATAKPDLYALAKEMMEQARRQGASQGRQMANQQAQQGGGGQPPGGGQ